MYEDNKVETIKNYKGEDENMEDNRISQITQDIAAYQAAIENAEGALAEAERELQEELERRYAE